MPHLQDITLPGSVHGPPAALANDFLNPLFRVASELLIVSPSLEPSRLARLTWGLSPFLQSGPKIKLCIALVDSVTDLPGTSLEISWREAQCDRLIRERLGALAWLLANERLSLTVRTLGPESIEPITTQLYEGIGFLIALDDEGTGIQILWKDIPSTDGTSQAAIDFRWSFGDPKRTVRSLLDQLRDLNVVPPSETAAPIEALVLNHLRHTERTAPPWREDFVSSSAGGVTLFPHQEDAIRRWAQYDYRSIFKMCTGAGKTISALAGVRTLVKDLACKSLPPPPVIVTIPTRVLADQWCREIRKMGFDDPLPAYNTFSTWFDRFEACLEFPRQDTPAFVVTTYRSFADERFQRVLSRLQANGQSALWVADEMHNLASPRLLKLCSERAGYFRYRLGLSATPEIEFEPEKTERLYNFFGGRLAASFELSDGIKQKVLCQYRYYPCPCYLNPELGRQYFRLLEQIDTAEERGRPDINLYRAKRDLLRKSRVQIQAFAGLLPHLIQKQQRVSHTLVYCPPGYGSERDERGAEVSDDSFDSDADSAAIGSETRLLDEVMEILRGGQIEVSSIIGETSGNDRTSSLREFADGRIQVVCAIGCLDEGVDIPSIRTAVVLSSVNREKQFIQRRGRILRRSRSEPDKIAEIYDIVILPQGSEMPVSQAEGLLSKELRRYRVFANLAINRTEADEIIQKALHVATSSESSSHTEP